MKTIKPIYYDNFKCIADRCPDTCCAGWEVEIDEETGKQYEKENSELKIFFDKHLTKNESGYCFELIDNRCPMLNESNLCRIQLKKGENRVCETCRLFPRYYDDYDDDIVETGLGLGCPEAARLLLSPQTKVKLNQKLKSSDDLYNCFSDMRENYLVLLDDSSIDLKTKIAVIAFDSARFQEEFDHCSYLNDEKRAPFSRCVKVLKKMEYIDSNRKDFLLSLTDKKAKYNNFEEYSQDFVRLFKYYLMRYMMTACYDLDLLTKIKYGIFACIVIKRIYNSFPSLSFDDRVRIFFSYSKEIEYSPINIDVLDTSLREEFTLAEMINLL